MPCLQIIAVTMAHIIVSGIDQGGGAEYTRHECLTDIMVTLPPPIEQLSYVRSSQEVDIETKRIAAMKADALGVPFDELTKCPVTEDGKPRWHMWEKCKRPPQQKRR